MKLIKEILILLLGRKYRLVVTRRVGCEFFEVASFIFEDTPQGDRRLSDYVETLKHNRSFELHEVVSFRSREDYGAAGDAEAGRRAVLKALSENK